MNNSGTTSLQSAPASPAELLRQGSVAEEKYRALLHRLDALVWEARLDPFHFTYLSPRAGEWLGLCLETAPRSLDQAAQWVHPDDRDRARATFYRGIESGHDFTNEFRVVARGKVLWLRDLVSIERDDEGVRLQGILFDITDRKLAEARLQLSERAIEATGAGIMITDARQAGNPIIYVNPAFTRLTGYDISELLGRDPRFLAGPGTAAHEAEELRDAFTRERPVQATLLTVRQDGSTFLNEVSVSPVRETNENADSVSHFIGVLTDITERHEVEARMLESNAILQATQDAAADGICLVDNSGNVVSCNQRFAEVWQIAPEVVEELRQSGQLMLQLLAAMQDPDEFIEKIHYLTDHPEASTRDQIQLKDGRIFERYSAPATSPQGQAYGRVWSFFDITDRTRYERQLKHQAFHDPLTELPNRAFFMENLSRAIARARRSKSTIAVLFLDLDRFKVVNDSLGHETGDLLLIETAQRLKACLRPGDMAARLGGDEFTVLLDEAGHIGDATHVAERIGEALRQPFVLGGHEVVTTCSIGVVLSHAGADRAEDLLRDADVAMYRAKSKGRAQYEVFNTAMSTAAFKRLKTEVELRQAIKRNELRVWYQPLVDLENGRIIGAEALVRWLHPERGLIPPADFIPLAEESGIIFPLGNWVLREACRQMASWQPKYFVDAKWEMSVNLSARQFQQPVLVEEIARILCENDLLARHLNLEVTESVMMEAGGAAAGLLSSLRKLGVQLSIDDFGTGYSSLASLKRFPLHTLKLDRSFIGHSGLSKQDAAIVQSIHGLAKALGMTVVAEGVETRGQLETLRDLGCDVGQGFFFSKPISHEEFEHLLQSQPTW